MIKQPKEPTERQLKFMKALSDGARSVAEAAKIAGYARCGSDELHGWAQAGSLALKSPTIQRLLGEMAKKDTGNPALKLRPVRRLLRYLELAAPVTKRKDTNNGSRDAHDVVVRDEA